MKYRRKPYEVEVIRFTGNNHSEICKFIGEKNMLVASELPHITIVTEKTRLKAFINDFIVKSIDGSIFATKPDIFTLLFEPVQEN
jgi:hypothetical protein